jgi:hypothetical protein
MRTKFWSEDLKGRQHSEDLDVDESLISEWILGLCERIFGPKREVDGSWRKLHNDELQSLYS